MYIYIYVKIPIQYEKTLTCNISGSESYGHSTEGSPELSHIPAEIAKNVQCHWTIQLGTHMWITTMQLL